MHLPFTLPKCTKCTWVVLCAIGCIGLNKRCWLVRCSLDAAESVCTIDQQKAGLKSVAQCFLCWASKGHIIQTVTCTTILIFWMDNEKCLPLALTLPNSTFKTAAYQILVHLGFKGNGIWSSNWLNWFHAQNTLMTNWVSKCNHVVQCALLCT